jgi:L-cysteine:1D-myo-inositol 2-amino-2-deoxy-alpha-D-glucopyranoside ligase
MPFRLRDTLSGELHELPSDRPISLYVCGITPYDSGHIGHAFTFVQFDALVRVLRWLGREVIYVQNVTDVDDSILRRARELGVDWKQLGDEELARHLREMGRLFVRHPTELVRATAVIPDIQSLIVDLLERGCAYAAEGSVFFRIGSASSFGELSKLDRESMLEICAQQDDADVDDPRKEDPLDVALWKRWSGDESEPRWDSSWGPGRPGWTIECAAINRRFLGPQLDLHGGGTDLVFPHHETEIALMETATGRRPFVGTWLHSGMVSFGGAKMAKSLGNLVRVGDVLERFGPEIVRLYLLSHHYRQDWDYVEDELRAAAEKMLLLRSRLDEPDGKTADNTTEEFRAAVEDDFDLPRALGVLERASGATARRLTDVLGLHPEALG